jgi:formylglycine-generating enzyme required for sulfatase activity
MVYYMVERVNKIISTLIILLLFCGILGCIESKKPVDDTHYANSSEFESDYTNSIGMKFMKIPAGEFMMGSPLDEEDRGNDEGPVHKVAIREPFYLGKFEVTQKQWHEVIGSNPSCFQGDNLPVEKVSWDDIQKFIKRLNEMERTDKYRLPSEAEWEYACRAGTTTKFSFGDDLADDESYLSDYAWYAGNSDVKTLPVGQMKPNSWDLYDMHGNVWEWVQDSYQDNYNVAPSNGSSWESGSSSSRVVRGGSWCDRSWDCRSANRDGYNPDTRGDNLGFRVLRAL